MKFNFRISFQT